MQHSRRQWVQPQDVCAALLRALEAGEVEARVHSTFARAINLSAPWGLLTLLAQDCPLQPYAVRLGGALPVWGALPGRDTGTLRFSTAGITSGNGEVNISWMGVRRVNLSLSAVPVPTGAGIRKSGLALRAFLQQSPVAQSLDGLVLGGEGSALIAFLSPRLDALRIAAAHAGKPNADICADLPTAAARFAGCGAGLTPSSDDVLCGYLATLFAFGGLPPALLRETAAAAAQKTGDISGAILLRLGDGLVSQPVLALIHALQQGNVPRPQLCAVAALGSTSGRDILTGICIGLLDMGGEAV